MMKNKVYGITETSKILGVSESSIRKYEKKYKINIERDSKNKRVYTDSDIKVFKNILEEIRVTSKNFLNYYCELLSIEGIELSVYLGKSKSYVSRDVQLENFTLEKARMYIDAFTDISKEKSNGEQILFIEPTDIFK